MRKVSADTASDIQVQVVTVCDMIVICTYYAVCVNAVTHVSWIV